MVLAFRFQRPARPGNSLTAVTGRDPTCNDGGWCGRSGKSTIERLPVMVAGCAPALRLTTLKASVTCRHIYFCFKLRSVDLDQVPSPPNQRPGPARTGQRAGPRSSNLSLSSPVATTAIIDRRQPAGGRAPGLARAGLQRPGQCQRELTTTVAVTSRLAAPRRLARVARAALTPRLVTSTKNLNSPGCPGRPARSLRLRVRVRGTVARRVGGGNGEALVWATLSPC